MVLLILAFIWAAALLPPFVRSRLDRSPADSVGRFRRHLRILQSTSPAASSLAGAATVSVDGAAATGEAMPAVWASEARRLRGLRRRRQIAVGLLGAIGATLVLGLFPPLRVLWLVNVAVDAVFVGYLVLLARVRSIETERLMNSHFARLRAEAAAEAAMATGEHPIINTAL